MNHHKIFVLMSLSFSSLGHAEAETQSANNALNSVLESAQTTFYDLIDKDMTTVNFAKGGSALTEAELRNIRAVYKSVLSDSEVTSIIVAAWSDREREGEGLKLPLGQVKLADKRALAIKEVLRPMTYKAITSYTMGEDTGWLSLFFPSKDAKVDPRLSAPDTATEAKIRALAKDLDGRGGPGKAVVIVQHQAIPSKTSGR